MQISRIDIVTLTKDEIIEAICDFVSKQEAGDGPDLDPKSIQFMIGDGKEYSGALSAAGTTQQ